mmetsp:Transcript_15044/g.35599  ORF Transcript_15044/g.35599 Transcript_15044/m.35599 type:complete len:296 (-) Transcript_15044:1663-2550(-)
MRASARASPARASGPSCCARVCSGPRASTACAPSGGRSNWACSGGQTACRRQHKANCSRTGSRSPADPALGLGAAFVSRGRGASGGRRRSGSQGHAAGGTRRLGRAAGHRLHIAAMQRLDALRQLGLAVDLLGMALEHQARHVDELGVARDFALLDQQFDGGLGAAAHRVAHGRLRDVEDLVMAAAVLLGRAQMPLGHRDEDLGAGLGRAVTHAQFAQDGQHLLEFDLLAGQADPQRGQQRRCLEVKVTRVSLLTQLARDHEGLADAAVEQVGEAAEDQGEAPQTNGTRCALDRG